MAERLQRILSQWGIASRRQAETMILEGRVCLNGNLAQLGQKANPAQDWIEVDGRLVQPATRPPLIYLLLHKPSGVVSTCRNSEVYKNVLDLLPEKISHGKGIHPVGRLDADSTGALLLTNDGALTFRLTHPRFCIPKTYRVWVQGKPSRSILKQWRQGIVLAGRKTLPAQVQVLKHSSGPKTHLEIVLIEGKNRQIRRVAEQLGHPVVHLHRTSIGSIQLQPPGEPLLSCGHYRFLKDREICFLKQQTHLASIRMPAAVEDESV